MINADKLAFASGVTRSALMSMVTAFVRQLWKMTAADIYVYTIRTPLWRALFLQFSEESTCLRLFLFFHRPVSQGSWELRAHLFFSLSFHFNFLFMPLSGSLYIAGQMLLLKCL